jgi:predicted nucleic acid-binding protein
VHTARIKQLRGWYICNIGCVTFNKVSFEQAIHIQAEAELLMVDNEIEVSSSDILSLVKDSSCSVNDSEFVTLAQNVNPTLVTIDKKILSDFPSTVKYLQHILHESKRCG